jgi:Tyrosine phosphatase family
MINDEFGGVEQYLEDKCGFSKEEIEGIRRNVVCEEPPCLYTDRAAL